MIDGRRLVHVYKNPALAQMAFDDFVAANPAAIASVNYRSQTVEMRNGDKVYFCTVRNSRDTAAISGLELNSVSVYKDMDEETRQYIRSRLRDPRGAHLVEYELIERED